MKELSIFLDESGSDGLKDRYYLLSIIAHDQEDDIAEDIALYEASIRAKGLSDIPFHASPLLNGHGDYAGCELAVRKKLLSTFRVFFRHLPIKCYCIKLNTVEYSDVDRISIAMRRELINFLFSRLEYFQKFDTVKIYYDNGQKSVADAVHKAIEYALAKGSFTYRVASPVDYRLSQVADYVCTMELTALKFENKRSTATDEKFFGSWRQFKKGILKELRAKQL